MDESRRTFTVARANKALPLVAKIAADVVARHAELEQLEAERRTAKFEALETVERRIFDAQGRIEHHVNELAQLGVELKDTRKGLVDFTARRDGEPICLCWMHGEPRVAWWHPVETGFAGRRPVSELPPEVLGEA
jgi:hypothetical protein